MALFPCSLCGVRFRGVARHAYVTWHRDSSSERGHLRLCRPHIEGFCELSETELLAVSDDERVPYPEITSCVTCKLPLEGSYGVVIVTAYPTGDDKTQWMAGIHHACELPGWLAEARLKAS